MTALLVITVVAAVLLEIRSSEQSGRTTRSLAVTAAVMLVAGVLAGPLAASVVGFSGCLTYLAVASLA